MVASVEDLSDRFNTRFTLKVPTTDHRTQPRTATGEHHFLGNGILHHDIVNIPFYGRIYDIGTIAHPLSNSDCFVDSRVRLTHILFLLTMLRDIQRQCRNNVNPSQRELRARQDSIDVLNMARRRTYNRMLRRPHEAKTNAAAAPAEQGSQTYGESFVESASSSAHHETTRGVKEDADAVWFRSSFHAHYQ